RDLPRFRLQIAEQLPADFSPVFEGDVVGTGGPDERRLANRERRHDEKRDAAGHGVSWRLLRGTASQRPFRPHVLYRSCCLGFKKQNMAAANGSRLAGQPTDSRIGRARQSLARLMDIDAKAER